MKLRSFLALVFCLSVLAGTSAGAAGAQEALWERTELGGNYVTVRLTYPEGQELAWADTQKLCVRYADTLEPVALSSLYKWGSYLFATVPAAQADRPLEVFQGDPLHFMDHVTVWEGHEYYDAPVGTDALNLRGVILGDGTGQLKADSAITRAEAFTILCRLLSLEPGEEPGFADVKSGDWYYETASAARAAGITNEPEYFRPLDSVTRGEFTVMLCRAMKTVGWLDEDAECKWTLEDWQVEDGTEIPDWALPSYLALASHGAAPALTWEETGESEDGGPVYKVRVESGRKITRGEVIEFVSSALSYVPLYPSPEAIAYGFDQAMPVIDGSTSTKPYTDAVYAALFDNYTNHPQYPAKHSKSYYSYERLISGEADLLFASTKPTEATLAKAKAAGVELELIPIAHDAMVFFTNSANSAENLTMEQIRNVYVDNAYTNWNELGGSDAAFVPYCRNGDSGSQAQMEEFFLKGAEIHPDIKRETTSVSMASVITDVEEAYQAEPLTYALGYSIYYYYQSATQILLGDVDALKLLAVEGVYPSDETIADGSYPLAGYNYAVVRSDEPEDSPARRMVDFMLSQRGQECVLGAGFGPLKPLEGA